MLLALRSLYEAPVVVVPPAIDSTVYYPNPSTPTSTASAASLQAAASIGIRSFGKPYFSMRSTGGVSPGPSAGERTFTLEFALYAPAVQYASVDELHVLWGIYHVTGEPAIEIGVTPSGKVGVRSVVWPGLTVLSPIGLVSADSTYHNLQILTLDGGLWLTLDGVRIMQVVISNPADPPTNATYVMFFNGIDGLTKCQCGIRFAQISPEANDNLRWMFNEGFGLTAKGEETVDGEHSWDHLPSDTEYPDTNFDVTAQWYDPSTYGYPLPYGSPPTSPVARAFRWDRMTRYGRIQPSAPGYLNDGSAGLTYTRRGPSSPLYRVVIAATGYTKVEP